VSGAKAGTINFTATLAKRRAAFIFVRFRALRDDVDSGESTDNLVTGIPGPPGPFLSLVGLIEVVRKQVVILLGLIKSSPVLSMRQYVFNEIEILLFDTAG
jgi:hypothetical protein